MQSCNPFHEEAKPVQPSKTTGPNVLKLNDKPPGKLGHGTKKEIMKIRKESDENSIHQQHLVLEGM